MDFSSKGMRTSASAKSTPRREPSAPKPSTRASWAIACRQRLSVASTPNEPPLESYSVSRPPTCPCSPWATLWKTGRRTSGIVARRGLRHRAQRTGDPPVERSQWPRSPGGDGDAHEEPEEERSGIAVDALTCWLTLLADTKQTAITLQIQKNQQPATLRTDFGATPGV